VAFLGQFRTNPSFRFFNTLHRPFGESEREKGILSNFGIFQDLIWHYLAVEQRDHVVVLKKGQLLKNK
jgi:hypothetical protein